MEKQKSLTPPTGGKKYNQTHLIEDKTNNPAAKGAKNNDELNDDKNNAKKRRVGQQLKLWYIQLYKPAKKNQNNNPL